jgi:hypothetical protein
MRLGAWRLSPYYGVDIDRHGPVPAADLAAATLTDGWSAKDGFLYNDRYPDLRIHYLGHPVPAGRYGVLGVPRDGLLALDGPMAELPLIAADATDAASIIASVQGLERGVDPLWMAYTFVGLMILIRPLARPFPGLRSFTNAPLLRRLAITAAVAAGLTAVAALAMP